MSRIRVTQEEDNEIPKDVLAADICRLSDSINKLILSGLNEKAVIVLLRDATGLSKRHIKLVIDAIGQLRNDYTHD